MVDDEQKMRALYATPTWSVATVMTIFVAVSLLVERSIHRLGSWLQKTDRKPLLEALEKMKEELMLLGFVSLVLTATSGVIVDVCIPSKFYNSPFVPCTESEIKVEHEHARDERNIYCKEDGHEPFVSDEVLEQLHQFIFVMAITHISYSCLTMLLAIVKIYSWRKWEDEARRDRDNSLHELTRETTIRRRATFVKYHTSNVLTRNKLLIWVTCFFRQFGHSVDRSDYLMLRQGFIVNHNLPLKYDFHKYMIRSMEEEFQMIVGVSGPLWGFVVFFMLFNIKGSNFYFWIAFIPIGLVLLIGAKLQYVIATLALESARTAKLKPRDDLFWFKKPELLLYLIHFILFQNAFELASFLWFWWQFGYNSCFIRKHSMLYTRLILGLAGQVLCSYSTLPLYALVTQMGTNHKPALIPKKFRDMIEIWKKWAKKKRQLRVCNDNSAMHADTSTMVSVDECDENKLFDHLENALEIVTKIELRASDAAVANETPSRASDTAVANEASWRAGTPLLRPSSSVSTPVKSDFDLESFTRCFSMPARQ